MNNIMLVVDDVELNREIMKVLFREEFQIMEAETGEEALEILEGCQGHIDIVLLDLMMPGLSGIELLKMRKNLEYFKDVPVVVITSSMQQEDQIEVLELGANDFISKPFIPEIVVSRVNNVMASSRRFLSMELEKQKLKIKSEIDEMTGLFNKPTTEFAMNDALKVSAGCLDVLMIIDIDNFKAVNDTSGHQVGDHVIKVITNMIMGHFRKTDIIGRIGGDEFCVLMVDVPSIEIARDKANELIQTMRYKPNLAIPEYVTLSIGLSQNDRKNSTYKDCFKKADMALYEAKESGKARYREYGVEPIDLTDDERPIAILISDNRSTSSSIHALMPEKIRIIEALSVSNLGKVQEKEKEKVKLIYADVSDYRGDTSQFWRELWMYDWISPDSVFAICQEGVVSQYIDALKNNVKDLYMVPLDPTTFKRRTMRQLTSLGLYKTLEAEDDRVIHVEE